MSAGSLEEALEFSDCPICGLVWKDSFDFVAVSVWSWVQEIESLSDLTARGGVCNCLADMVRQMTSNRDMRVLYRALIACLLANLQNAEDRASGTVTSPRVRCVVWKEQERSARRWTAEFLARLNATGIRSAYAAGRGLCLPHFALAMEQSASWQRVFWVAGQCEQLRRLHTDANHFVRKHDARQRGDMTQPEKDAARAAVLKFACKHGVQPGNENSDSV